jgi:DNA-directed RNA polymerase specialized sigma subunit
VASKFDPNRNIKFSTYATHTIRGYVTNAVIAKTNNRLRFYSGIELKLLADKPKQKKFGIRDSRDN